MVTAGMGYPFRYGIDSLLLNSRGERFIDAEFLLGIEPRSDGRTERIRFTLDRDGAHRDHPECRGHEGMRPVRGTLGTRSAALADLDRYGDPDIVINEFNDRPRLLFSEPARRRPVRHLPIRLIGTRYNRDGLGVLVQVTAEGRTSTRFRNGKSGYLSRSSLPLHFGLGILPGDIEAEITVQWPSGARQTRSGPLPPDGFLLIEEQASPE